MTRRTRDRRRMIVAAVAVLALAGAGKTAQTVAAPSSVSGNVALGQQLAKPYGWGSGPQWTCLDELWQQESSWSNTADNSDGGAYGIPQALPASKMPAAALPPENSASVQIKWGLGYISGRYGDPCTAWGHEEADGWY
jgi:resuscitation-promoting factor RpfB